MAGTGGARPGAGRKPGVVSKARKEIRDLISTEDVKMAFKVLRNLMRKNDLDAAKYFLDQKYGKARQTSEIELKNKAVEDFLKELGAE